MIELSRRAMGAREMNALTGGNVCGCGCHGPSSTQANANANYKGNKSSNGSQSPDFVIASPKNPHQIV